ncbi:MAG: hypothetical protein WBP22_03770 [Candidatus Saccharimonas sp.]
MRIQILQHLGSMSKALETATTLITAATTIAVAFREIKDAVDKRRGKQDTAADLDALRAQVAQTFTPPSASRDQIEQVLRELLLEYAAKQAATSTSQSEPTYSGGQFAFLTIFYTN